MRSNEIFINPAWSIVIFLLVSMSLLGCNESFQPLKQKDGYAFSIYGYLDASADTQWVRVTPARSQVSMQPQIPEMQVTLEELETGNTVSMNDSLFQLPNGVNFVNVWTTMDVKPGHAYRLVAKRPEGTSSATVTTPSEFPPVLLRYLHEGCQARLDIYNVEKLADVYVEFHYRNLFRVTRARTPYRDDIITRDPPDNYTVYIDLRDSEGVFNVVELFDINVVVAAGGPEWIEDIHTMNDLEYALPEGLSNVKNGVGYMVGIVTQKVPYEECYF